MQRLRRGQGFSTAFPTACRRVQRGWGCAVDEGSARQKLHFVGFSAAEAAVDAGFSAAEAAVDVVSSCYRDQEGDAAPWTRFQAADAASCRRGQHGGERHGSKAKLKLLVQLTTF